MTISDDLTNTVLCDDYTNIRLGSYDNWTITDSSNLSLSLYLNLPLPTSLGPNFNTSHEVDANLTQLFTKILLIATSTITITRTIRTNQSHRDWFEKSSVWSTMEYLFTQSMEFSLIYTLLPTWPIQWPYWV